MGCLGSLRLLLLLAGRLPSGAALVAAASGGPERLPLLCRCPAERPDATAATARRSGLPPTDGAAVCRSGTRQPVAIAAVRQSGPLLPSLRLGNLGSPLLLVLAVGRQSSPTLLPLPGGPERLLSFAAARRSGLTPLQLLPGGHQLTGRGAAALCHRSCPAERLFALATAQRRGLSPSRCHSCLGELVALR